MAQHLDSRILTIVVYGTPAPQGSKKFLGRTKTGRGILGESSKKVKPWREAVKWAAIEARTVERCDEYPNGLIVPLDAPLRVSMVFTMPKPGSAPKRRRIWPMRLPDLSKLARSTEDALTDAGIWADDARVVEYGRLAKVFPGEDPDALDAPGVVIRIQRIDLDQQELLRAAA